MRNFRFVPKKKIRVTGGWSSIEPTADANKNVSVSYLLIRLRFRPNRFPFFFHPPGPFPFSKAKFSLQTLPRIARNRGVVLATLGYCS